MPPKAKAKGKGKGKGKKGKGKTGPPVDPCPQFQMSETNLEEKELDLLTDLNDDFFVASNKTIQMLMEGNRVYEAAKLKKYSDIIYNLHSKYEDEVKEMAVMRPQVERASHKLRLALELTVYSQEALDKLRLELEHAWREVDASTGREQDAQDRIQELAVKCEGLEDDEEKNFEDGAELGPLAKYKNIILRERDRLNGEVMDLEKRLQFQRFYTESLEYVNKTNEEQIAKTAARLRLLESDKANFEIKIRGLVANVEEQKEHNLRTNSKLESANRELSDTKYKLSRKIADFDNLKLVIEKVRSDNTLYQKQVAKYEDEIFELRKVRTANEDTIRSLRYEDKVKASTISQLSKKFKKALEDYSAIASKLYKLNRANYGLGEDIVRLKNQINGLEKGLLTSTSKYEELRILKENIQRERDAARSDIVKLNNTIADLRHTIVLKNIYADGLNMDIKKLNIKLDEARGRVSKAEAERDEMMQEVDTLNLRIESYQEQVEMKTNQVTDLTEKLNQNQQRLINANKQLDAAHSEKMVLKRNLETCTEERDNFRVLQAKTNFQISQLTLEITANQNKITNLKLQIEKLNNDKKDLQSQLKHKEDLLASLRRELRDMKKRNDSLLKTIYNDEAKFVKMSQDIQNSEKQKNLIGLQVVRRNDEIVVLKEKITIMQTALDQGQTQYNQRVRDINLLKLEIKELQRQRDCQTTILKSVADMREEIIRLERSLNEERTRLRSLLDDARTPAGIHRWRVLKGTDPERFVLLEKVQTLQRINLKRDKDVKNLKAQLNENQETIDSLKHIIDNLPASNVKQKLVAEQRAKRNLEKKLKVVLAESLVNQAELKSSECVVKQLKEALKNVRHEVHDETSQTDIESSYDDTSYSTSSLTKQSEMSDDER